MQRKCVQWATAINLLHFSLQSPIIPGDLTKHKFETLGTHAGVAHAREEFYAKTYNMRNSTVRSKWLMASTRQFFFCFALHCFVPFRDHNSEGKNRDTHLLFKSLIPLHWFLYFFFMILADLAKQHADFIDREALCKVPRPRVISIPLHPSQSYMPPCTILHRCNDDTGCCKSHTLKCVPKQYEIVTLYFIVSNYDSGFSLCDCDQKSNFLNKFISGQHNTRSGLHWREAFPQSHRMPLCRQDTIDWASTQTKMPVSWYIWN